jgi:hypothetical protein
VHPVTGKPMSFSSVVPADLQQALAVLGLPERLMESL